MAQLQVGDNVYSKTHYGVGNKYTVIRVSAKRAFCDSLCILKAFSFGKLSPEQLERIIAIVNEPKQ